MIELHDQREIRIEKLNKIKNSGVLPYPHGFHYSHSIQEVKANSASLLERQTVVRIAGRLMSIRGKGKTSFCHLQEEHHRIQIYLRKDALGDEAFERFEWCDIGDFFGIEGTLMLTQTGELTVRVSSFQLLAKSLRPLPAAKVAEVDGEKIVYDEVKDKEFRYRQRYVDLVLNEKVAQVFRDRAKIFQTIRNYLIENQFLEVETPTLQTIYGGAHATPFVTHHKALGVPFYLRISNELFLKRLIVGGFNRVFEFVKNFRNEGIDRTHNPEFTALEFYQAYADYQDMMVHCEMIWEQCALTLHGTTELIFQGNVINLKTPWKRMTMLEAIETVGNIPFSQLNDTEIQQLLMARGWRLTGEYARGRAMSLIFEESCESLLIQPTFITDYPAESSPLCKAHRSNPELIERFEAYMNGWEIANAYTELNDPLRQRQLMEEQVERGRGGKSKPIPMMKILFARWNMECLLQEESGLGLIGWSCS